VACAECLSGAKPVYSLIVLPFEHEEKAEERALYNTAVCLKSVYSVADALEVPTQALDGRSVTLQNSFKFYKAPLSSEILLWI